MENINISNDSLEFAFNIESVINENRITLEEIDEIYEWTRSTNLPRMEKEQIVFFIISCDRDIEFTKKTITENYKAKVGAPELFTNRNVGLTALQEQLDVIEFSIFPEKTDDGCIIIFHKLYDTAYHKYNMEPSMKLLFMTLESAMHESPPTGLIVLGDMKGISLMHLTKVKIALLKTFFHYGQEGLPIKLKSIHLMNCVSFVDKLMTIVKPFLKKEVLKLVNFHSCNTNMEEFYEKHIPKKCLPIDYGGDLPSTHELHMENTKNLENLTKFFEAEEKQRTSV